jgi:hypothetical protein
MVVRFHRSFGADETARALDARSRSVAAIPVAVWIQFANELLLGASRTRNDGSTFDQFRGPLSSMVTTNPGGIFGGSSIPQLILQSGHGIPGTPHWQVRRGRAKI